MRNVRRVKYWTERWLGKSAVIGALAVLSVGQLTAGIAYVYVQNERQRETFCVAIQPYNVEVRKAAESGLMQPEASPSTQRLRAGFEKMEERLSCTADPYDGK